MLYLMLHVCTKRYKTEDGEEAVLIPFTGGPGGDFRDSFLFVAAQSIAAIWGPNFARSLICRLKFTVEADTLPRSEEHTSELQSLMRISYAVFCLKKKKNKKPNTKFR